MTRLITIIYQQKDRRTRPTDNVNRCTLMTVALLNVTKLDNI